MTFGVRFAGGGTFFAGRFSPNPSSLARYSIGGDAPAAVADFSAGVYGINGAPVGFDGLFSFTRLSAAWKRNALGHWVKTLAGEPRTGHHIRQGGKLVPAGIAVCSEVRTNLLLNSDTLSTQSVTVSAVELTLSFTGTGTVTLSGAATDGPLVGTGSGSANRVTLSFTPSAGSLTLTVSGDVQNAQLEAGPYATDYISTEAAQVSTAAESLQIDPVGLSKSVGVQGSELILNGGFDGSSDWTLGDGWTISGGAAQSDGSQAGFSNLSNAGGLPFQQSCIGVITVTEITAGRVRPNWGSAAGSWITEVGVHEFLIPSAGGYFFAQADTDFIGTVDDVSIRQVTIPDELTFLMKGTMTYADDETANQVRFFNWEAGVLDRLRQSLRTHGSRTGQVEFLQSTTAEGIADALSAEDAYSPGTNVPFSLAFVLSATEIEGFYNGISTGKTAYGGMANLLSAPLQLFPVGNATLEEFHIWAEALPSAAMIEATS